MTDELKQLAEKLGRQGFMSRRFEKWPKADQELLLQILRQFRAELQRQTVEAAAWSPYLKEPTSVGCCVHCKQYMDTSADILNAQRHSVDCPIRALLSPAQEVRNG